MKDWRVWALVIGLYLLVKMCGGCNGCSSGLDLSEKNVLELVPESGSTYKSMTLTLYADGTYEVEGIIGYNNEEFHRTGNYTFLNDSYHDEVQQAVGISAPSGYGYHSVGPAGYGYVEKQQTNSEYCITGDLEMYRTHAGAESLYTAKRNKSKYLEGVFKKR